MTTPSSATFWTTRAILAFASMLLLSASAVGASCFLIYLRYIKPRIRARQNRTQVIYENVVGEKAQSSHIACHDANSSAVSHTWPPLAASTWSKMPSEHAGPDLPWPVLAVLPSLRPKEPLYVRLKKSVRWWEKKDAKHEPFTVADVKRAIEEVNGHVEDGNQEEVANTELPSHCRDMPEIVVHPCDGSPSFSPSVGELYLVATSASLPTPEMDISEVSITTTTTSMTSLTDGSFSEPATPLVATPVEESFSLTAIAYMNSLQVSTECLNPSDEDQNIAIDVSNFSGRRFILGSPPSKRRSSECGKRLSAGPQIGLGIVSSGVPGPMPEEDAEFSGLPHPAFSTDSSIARLIQTLEHLTSDSGPLGSPCIRMLPSYSTSSSEVSTTDAAGGCPQSSTWGSNDPLSERLSRLIRAFSAPTPPSGEESNEGAGRGFTEPSISEDLDLFECSADLEVWMAIGQGITPQRTACVA